MKNRKKIIVIVSIFLVAMVAILYGVVNTNFKSNKWSTSYKSVMNDNLAKNMLKENIDVFFQKNKTRKVVAFAIYGTDERSTEIGRSDTVMVVMYDPSLKKLTMVSLPRDLRVNIPGHGLDKLTHAYFYNGRELADQTIEELLDIKLDFSVKFSFASFTSIIDDIGGVSINAEKDFNDSNGNLVVAQGKQVLNGEKALFYVRFRSDSESDYGRIRRQQEVIMSLIESLKAKSINEKIELIETYYNKGMETDAKIAKIIEYVDEIKTDNIITYETYTLQTHSEIIDGLGYAIYDQKDLNLIKNLFVKNKKTMNLEKWE